MICPFMKVTKKLIMFSQWKTLYQFISGIVKSSLFALSLFSSSFHRVSTRMKRFLFFFIFVSGVPCTYGDLISFLQGFSITRNVILLPSSCKNELLPVYITIPKPQCDELTGSSSSLLALQFPLAPTYTLLLFIKYTYQETWRYITLISCSRSTQDMLLFQKQSYVFVLMTGAFHVAV